MTTRSGVDETDVANPWCFELGQVLGGFQGIVHEDLQDLLPRLHRNRYFLAALREHLTGVNTAFADGSVRFIKSSIGYPTWAALGTRAGGEVVSSDAY